MGNLGRCLVSVFMVLSFVAPAAMAKEAKEFVISVETVMDHPRNQGLLIFIKNLEKRSHGQLKAKLYHSAQLYKDTDILKALGLGTVDMGLPGIWFLDKIDPNAALTALPMFYAQPSAVTEKLVDGRFGQMVNESLENKMKVKIPGAWYELGYVALHTSKKKITELEDLKGLRIRYFGSKANAERLRAMGASPVPIPWPDMAMALMRGTCDGLITSFKPLHSAKLVEAGITYSVMDREYLMHYVPICSQKFWNSLSPELQKLFVEVWNEHIPQERQLAREMQREGEKDVEELEQKKGGGVYRPSDEKLARWRKQIMPIQDQLVKDLKIDPKLVKTAMDMLGM
jgi:TRAP-type C4-dicarboxylate transport system substrate-binding protein